METPKTKIVEYRIVAKFKQIGKKMDEKVLRKLFETKLKSAEIFHLPSGFAEVAQVKRIYKKRRRRQAVPGPDAA